MTSDALARAYFDKARKRIRALEALFADEGYSDVIRKAQELVELVLKGMLRFVGIEPPKQHDVGPLLVAHRDRLPTEVAAVVERLAAISHRLRKERECAFYGDEDFIPTEEYSRADAEAALADARFALALVAAFPAVTPENHHSWLPQEPRARGKRALQNYPTSRRDYSGPHPSLLGQMHVQPGLFLLGGIDSVHGTSQVEALASGG